MSLRTLSLLALPLLIASACVDGDDTDTETPGETDTPAVDADNDGYSEDEDCDDTNADIYPGAPEDDCTDPVDYNCDGVTEYADADDDGWAECVDCDDDAALVNPDADEECDGIDNDCDTLVDDEDDDVIDLETFYEDQDEDLFGNAASTIEACAAPDGYVSDASDCNDDAFAINPEATEVCDGDDNDCDTLVDDDDDDVADQGNWYADSDEDALGDAESALAACEMPEGYVDNDLDCDDANKEIGEATVWYQDRDKDTFGLTSATRTACEAPTGYVAIDGDCDDRDDEAYPGAPEICDEKDNDCDMDIDDDDADITGQTDWYIDDDGDDYGDEDDTGTTACFAPTDHVDDNTDCDDTTHLVYPGRFDFDDDEDNDCDGSVDEDVGTETYDHSSDIQSIWSSKCTGCHGTSGGLTLTSAYTKIVNVASDDVSSMDRIEPGDLRNSYLWHKLEGTHRSVGGAGSTMPLSGSLSSSQRSTIETWILEGAIE